LLRGDLDRRRARVQTKKNGETLEKGGGKTLTEEILGRFSHFAYNTIQTDIRTLT
jgi:hypothetical protein